MKRAILVLVGTLTFLSTVSAQTGNTNTSKWTLTTTPSFIIPLTAGDFSPNELFSSAWGGSFGAEYSLPNAIPLALRLGAGYSTGGFLPSSNIDIPGSLGETTVLCGVSYTKPVSSRFSLRGFIDAGVSYGSLSTGENSTYAALQAGLGVAFTLVQSWAARLDAFASYKVGLYSGAGVGIGAAYILPVVSASRKTDARPKILELKTLELGNIFPIFRSYYDTNPIGNVTIVNTGKEAAANVRVSFLIRQYMDGPKECAVIPKIEAGKSISLPLYGLFNDSILGVTEATKVTAEVLVEYGADMTQSRTATVLVYDRNALTWADDRHAAAFVSSKDPWVLDLTGNFVAATKDSRNAEVSKNLQAGIAFHEGLRVYGIGYVLSPNRPFAQEVVNPEIVDSLKFPRQTLGYKAGDCADLSVLYASFFEAAGIETAFVTVPGHIFMAFDSGFTLEDVRVRSLDERDFIVTAGKVWVPVETTLRSAGFVEAWRKAAGEWRESVLNGEAAFYPIHEAWLTFAPVGLPADGSTATPPAPGKVKSAFDIELAKIVKTEINARIALLGPAPASGGAKFLNSRGLLYAKYGFYAEAEKDLKASARDLYPSALVNLGNISLLKDNGEGAYSYFKQASSLIPDNPRLLVNLAKAASALGKNSEVVALLDQVTKLDPKIAEQYASLAQSGTNPTRAAAAEGEMLWF